MKILFLGDSITSGGGAGCFEKAYVYRVGEILGIQTVAYGEGGTRIARQTLPSEVSAHDEDFNKRALQMDEEADFVFVFGGTNDFGHGDAPIGDKTDNTVYTFHGAINCLTDYLIEKYGKEKLCFITPLHRYDEDNTRGEFGAKARPSLPLTGYVDIIRQSITQKGIDLLDLFDEKFFPKPKACCADELTADGLHPNPTGHTLLAKRICAYLMEKFPNLKGKEKK